MKWKLNLPEPRMLVYYFVKLTGLAPFTVKNNKFYPLTLLGKVYSASFAAIDFFLSLKVLVVSTSRIFSKNFPSTVKIAGAILRLTSFPTTFLTVIIFLFANEKILRVMNKLCVIGNDLKRLGIAEDKAKFFKNLFVASVSMNAVVIAVCVTLTVGEPNWPMFLSIKYSFDTWFYCNTIFIFAQTLFCIKKRFELVNEKLRDAFRPVGHLQPLRNSRIFMRSRNPREENQAGIDDLTDLERVRKIEAVHLELCELVDQTIRLFQIPILLKTLELCIELIVSGIWVYGIIHKSSQIHINAENVWKYMSFSLFKMAVSIVQLFPVAVASVKTCQEGNATKAVLFKVWYKFKPRKLEDEFVMFSLQMLHNPVTASAFGFFDLDYSYIYKILCTVVGYVIIMIQFETA